MEIPDDPRVREALSLAMRQLAKRAYLSWELGNFLETREYSRAEIEDVLSLLQRQKLLNDKETIQNLIESKSGRQSIGAGKLRFVLRKRGVPDEVIEDVIAPHEGVDALPAALEALNGRSWPPGGRARAARFLLSRGFDEETVESALNCFFVGEELPPE